MLLHFNASALWDLKQEQKAKEKAHAGTRVKQSAGELRMQKGTMLHFFLLSFDPWAEAGTPARPEGLGQGTSV
jgi:hypothetical protein